MYEGAGLTAHDLSAFQRLATLYNLEEADWVSGPSSGSAIHFDGSAEYGEHTESVVTTVPLTLSCWARQDASHTGGLLAVGGENGSDSHEFALVAVSGDMWALTQAGTGSYLSKAIASITNNVWHHWVAVFEANNLRRIYRDGVLIDTDTGSYTPNTSFMYRTRIARRANNNAATQYFDGIARDARVWSRALADSEVLDLYLNPWAPFQQRNQVVVPTITAASINYTARQFVIKNGSVGFTSRRLTIRKY
jgi:hypothetical protein